jgi:surface-anchored protein
MKSFRFHRNGIVSIRGLMLGGVLGLMPAMSREASGATYVVFEEDHADLAIAWSAEDSWRIGLEDHHAEALTPLEKVVVLVPEAAKLTVPNDPQYAFLGVPGAETWILPQVETAGVPFLGINGHEIAAEVGPVGLVLDSVSGPGSLSLYTVGVGSFPAVAIHSGDGIDEDDQILITPGGHYHYNWAFSEPGWYRIGWRVRDGEGVLSEPRWLLVGVEEGVAPRILSIAWSPEGVHLTADLYGPTRLEHAPAPEGPWSEQGVFEDDAELSKWRGQWAEMPMGFYRLMGLMDAEH